MNRREFIFCASAASALPGLSLPVETCGCSIGEKFVWVILGEQRDAAGQVITRQYQRMVMVDINRAEDRGQFAKDVYGDYDDSVWFGDDELGYWKVEKAFEFIEPTEELHEERFPVSFELSLYELMDMVIESSRRFDV